MVPRVTQTDLARELGLHVTTVSKALRDHPDIAAETRRRVQTAAARQGYVPDPMLGALAAYRGGKRPAAFRAVLGWVSNYPKRQRMDGFAGFEDYFLGARARAETLGYKLDPFFVEGPPERLARVLQARGIGGLIVAPQVREGVRMLAFPWERFSAVTIGFTLAEPRLHVVTNDHFRTLLSLVETLRARGYRRLGCYLRERDNARIEGRFRSALAALLAGWNHAVLDYAESDRETFLRWRADHGFDAVITGERAVAGWLRESGVDVPKDCGVAHYALAASEREVSGMDHNNARIGAAAVDWVTGLLQRGEKGPPELPFRLMVASQWVEGATLRVE